MISKRLEDFLGFLRETEEAYNMASADVQDAENATQDILHSLELGKHNYHEMAHLSKKLRGVRQKRRVAKDIILQSEPIITWLESNHPTVKGLERLLGEVRKAENRTQNRTYIPRTDVMEEAETKG